MLEACIRRSSPLVLSALAIVACANSGRSAPDGDGGGGASGSGSGGAGGSSGSSVPGDDGPGRLAIPDASAAGDTACQHFDVQVLPRIPLVYVLVDRSGSVFTPTATADGGQVAAWGPLRTATLAVIQNLQSRVAFGFGSYTGINPNTTPAMCPILDPLPTTLPIALNNYPAIAARYSALVQPAFKAETPAQKTLEVVAQTLTQAASQADGGGGGGQPGGKYILFVTDGETDFCDDGNPVCPADAVIAELQKLHGEGIQTIILGIGSSLSNISIPVLQSFANAGAGLAALAPPGSAQGAPLAPGDIYNQCSSVAGWNQLLVAAGRGPAQALGSYGTAPASNAAVYSPNATDVADLTNQLAAALSTVKSCSFDLQGKVKVDLAHASRGKVTVDGTAVSYDPTSGWTMASATQVDLVGDACQKWRASGQNIAFDFPCDVLIVLQ